jgi:spore germination protein GerM
MKYLTAAILASLCLFGFGCLEGALKYPKDYTSETNETTTQIVETVGVVRSVDNENGLFQIETAGGFTEEIGLTPETAIISNDGAPQTFVEVTPGVLVEIIGSRDPVNLILKAETIKINDLAEITLASPRAGATVTSPLILEGFTKTIGKKIHWRVKDANNAVQASGSSAIRSDEKNYTPFRIEIYLPALETNAFVLEAFSQSEQTESGLVSLPLNLLSTNKSGLQIFFANSQQNAASDCLTVAAVTRTVAETSAIGRAALLELLNGPTEEEETLGFRSSLPADMTINSFIISGGTATLTISKDFHSLGVCNKQRAEQQIKQTLLQIDSVDEVVIQVEK